MEAAIEARGLVRTFGSVRAVDSIDLTVPTGAVYGFLGPNGSGKTTTIRLLLGLLRPDGGTVRVLGGSTTDRSILSRVGAVVERPALYPYLSARDNLRLFGMMAEWPRWALPAAIDRVLATVDLDRVADRKTGGFSTGMLQRLAIALALLRDPELVILDEPTNGLDPGGVVEVRELIATLARSGHTIFLSTHVLTEVEQLCDRVAILQRGRIVADGATRDLLERGQWLEIVFDTCEEAAAADACLRSNGLAVEPAGDRSLKLGLDATPSSAVARLLGGAGLYPAELVVRRASLESVFLELTEGV